MGFDQKSAVEKAKRDLAGRLKISADEIDVNSVSESDFPDMSLGAPERGEMSGQMISSGWSINLGAGGKKYEYRADQHQLRLHNFNGSNYVIG